MVMAEGEDEEDDYMSDKYLLEAPGDSSFAKPGSSKKRRLTHLNKPKVKRKQSGSQSGQQRKKIETELREKGLSTPLTGDNRGFSMLHKMGYTPGMGLGKEGQGRTVPVSVSMKQGNQGLGRAVFEKETAEQKKQDEVKTVSSFVQNKQKHFDAMRLKRDLWRSQLSCQQLDAQKDIDKPLKPWYWPPSQVEVEEEEEEEEEEPQDPPELSEQLVDLTLYLRCQHCYCVWCGTVYNGEKDLQESCPGITADDHD